MLREFIVIDLYGAQMSALRKPNHWWPERISLCAFQALQFLWWSLRM